MSGPADILLQITRRRRQRLAGSLLGALDAPGEVAPLGEEHPFLEALGRPGRSIIAEVKLGSPRLGDLRERLVPETLAETYAHAGAVAMSVVVEPDYFHGDYGLVGRCARASGLPVLAKDFVVDRVQLEMAAAAGAAAVLLIAALYEPVALRGLANEARRLGMVPLVETHEREDVDRLAGGVWEAVGVNNRDLRTFDVDIAQSIEMAPRLPTGCLRISESGLRRPQDLERLTAAGFDGFLIGESLLTAADPEAKLRQLVGSDVGSGEVS